MSIIINSRNKELPENLKEYIEEKVSAVLEGLKPPTVCEVTLIEENGHRGLEKKEIRISCTLPDVKNPVFVSETGDDYYKIIDLAEDKLSHAIHKAKR